MVPVRVHTIVISTQHDDGISNEQIAKDLREHVIGAVVPKELLDDKTIYHLNPSGRFVIGGPHGDAGECMTEQPAGLQMRRRLGLSRPPLIRPFAD